MSSLQSFAQNFEDVMLWRALGHIPNGQYLDIGAQDPRYDSVSKVFYDRGWRGIHVEPMKFYAAQLRAYRPEEKVVTAGIGSSPGLADFYEFAETGLSTFNKVVAAEHKRLGRSFTQSKRPIYTLDDIFEANYNGKDLHWMKIDVEGNEKDVLEGWKNSNLRPWIVVVESINPVTRNDVSEQWISILRSKGYEDIWFDSLNRFFIHESQKNLKVYFKTPPNLFDGFAISRFSSSNFANTIRQQWEKTLDFSSTMQPATIGAKDDWLIWKKCIMKKFEDRTGRGRHEDIN